MTPSTAQYSNDSESLQADVMRFMAIIAFCLIAILALVKNADPVEATQQPEPPAPTPAPQLLSAPTDPLEPIPEPAREIPQPLLPEPEPVIAKTVEPVPAKVMEPAPPVAPAPLLEPQPAPTRRPTRQLAATQKPAEPIAEPEPKPEPEQQAQHAPVAEPNPRPTEEAGLTLRFASDGDFLRLIAKGDIKVYAFQETDVLGLNGSYRFMDSPSPGQVYELLTTSIPSLIIDALREERSDIRAYRWGIALPNRISSQIEQYLDRVEQGQLVIDRYGDVHHVAAS